MHRHRVLGQYDKEETVACASLDEPVVPPWKLQRQLVRSVRNIRLLERFPN